MDYAPHVCSSMQGTKLAPATNQMLVKYASASLTGQKIMAGKHLVDTVFICIVTYFNDFMLWICFNVLF